MTGVAAPVREADGVLGTWNVRLTECPEMNKYTEPEVKIFDKIKSRNRKSGTSEIGFFARVCFLSQCGYPLSYTCLRRGRFAKSTISACEMGFIGA